LDIPGEAFLRSSTPCAIRITSRGLLFPT
jgi:hypothetical protein